MTDSLTIACDNTTPTSGGVCATRRSGPAVFGIPRSCSLLELEAWVPSEIEAISSVVDQLMQLIEAWRCIAGNESAVELAVLTENSVRSENAELPIIS